MPTEQDERTSPHRALFASLVDACARGRVVDDDGACDLEIVEANGAFLALTGAGDATGRRVRALLEGAPRGPSELSHLIDRVASHGVPERVERTLAWLGRHAEITAYRTGPGEITVVVVDRTRHHLTEERLRGVLESLDDLVFSLDLEGRFVDYQAPAAHLLYAPPSAFLGKRYADVLPPEVTARVDAGVAQATRTGRPALVEYAMWLDGAPSWWSAKISARRSADGAITGVTVVSRDVTELRRADEARAASEERSRLALDAAGLGTWRHDLTTDLVHLDARAQAMFALPADLPLPELLQRVHPDDLPRVMATTREGLSPDGAGRVSVEHRVVHPDGTVRWLSDHVLVHFEGEGASRHPVFAVATAQDVTAARLAAEAVRASDERYRMLVDALDDVIFSSDDAGVVTFVSRAIERYGYARSGVVGRVALDFLHPDDRARAAEHLAASRRSARPITFEARFVDASGGERHGRVTLRPLGAGDATGTMGIVVDKTSQRAAEAQFRAAQRMEAVGRLAGGVAHDFNNLLSVILTSTDLALHELPEGAPLRPDLEEVLGAARRAEGLTRQLLAFSRRQVLAPEPVALDGLVDGLARMLGRLIGEDVEVAIDRSAGSSPVLADRGQLEQVVMNLAVNARDAMPHGGRLTIATRDVDVDEARAAAIEVLPGRYVELAVADTGVGMTPDVAARVFEPFFTTKAIGKGTGLGLSMVFGFVRQSGGAVTVDSAPGQGTTFRVLLPRHQGSVPAAAPARPRVHRGHETLLVVEDEPALRSLAKRMLEPLGYEVLTAASGAEALAIVAGRAAPIDLVVTDVIMPGMSGPELAERLRTACPSTPVVFMSGYTDEELEPHAVTRQRFLRKPFDRATLAATVRGVLDAR